DLRALSSAHPGETTEQIQARVLAARELQLGRQRAGVTQGRTNSELLVSEFDQVLQLTNKAQLLLDRAALQLALSARAHGKVLRVARTIADLEQESRVGERHVHEALQGRLLEQGRGGQASYQP
ncbi:MAG: hypothetical protein RJA70_3979, partial [Pseudomonadota bacterium]